VDPNAQVPSVALAESWVRSPRATKVTYGYWVREEKAMSMRDKATEYARRKGKALSSHLTTEGFAGDKGGKD